MATQVALGDARAQEEALEFQLAFKKRAWVPTFFFMVDVVAVRNP